MNPHFPLNDCLSKKSTTKFELLTGKLKNIPRDEPDEPGPTLDAELFLRSPFPALNQTLWDKNKQYNKVPGGLSPSGGSRWFCASEWELLHQIQIRAGFHEIKAKRISGGNNLNTKNTFKTRFNTPIRCASFSIAPSSSRMALINFKRCVNILYHSTGTLYLSQPDTDIYCEDLRNCSLKSAALNMVS